MCTRDEQWSSTCILYRLMVMESDGGVQGEGNDTHFGRLWGCNRWKMILYAAVYARDYRWLVVNIGRSRTSPGSDRIRIMNLALFNGLIAQSLAKYIINIQSNLVSLSKSFAVVFVLSRTKPDGNTASNYIQASSTVSPLRLRVNSSKPTVLQTLLMIITHNALVCEEQW